VFLFCTAFFGTALLMPLYFQVVRGESALHAGLLLAVQGVGAMIAMPIAARLTDKLGARRIVMVGLTLVALGMLSLSQISGDTTLLQVELTLFVVGMGMGSTMMPAMSAALSSIERHAVARVTAGLNVLQRVGGSIGTALLAVVLSHELAAAMPVEQGAATVHAGHAIASSASGHAIPALGVAFGHTFIWSFALVVGAWIVSLFISRAKAEGAKVDSPHVVVE